MSGTGNTTVPADPKTRSSTAPVEDKVFALVICQCTSQPEREGEVALLDPADAVTHWIIGREIAGGPARVHFFIQRPGEMIDAGALTGKGISQEQLRVSLYGDALLVCNVGNAAVYVDGSELPKDQAVIVRAGAVIEVFGHSVFVVERRPRKIPHPHRLLLPLPPFGERCSMGFDGESPDTWQLREDVAYAADAQANILILGETGTGKGVTASAIHAKSQRARGPFKAVNCAEQTAELIAARFFGIRKNFPNPGTPETAGYFGDAAGGDLFLDEIGNMDKGLQGTLLHAIEQGYTRVGETDVRHVRCKVTAGTNKGEESLAEDLLMRFGFVIRTPPLRQRPSDIAQVVRQHLLQRAREHADFAKAFVKHDASGRPYVLVDPALIVNMLRHPLPGNVRQVRTILDTCIRTAQGVAPLRWPSKVPAPPPAQLVPVKDAAPSGVSIEELEEGLNMRIREEAARREAAEGEANGRAQRPSPSKARVLEALDRHRWHFGNTAKALGVTEHQLYRLRQKFGRA